MADNDLENLSLKKLQELAQGNNLSKVGTKAILVKRLREWNEEKLRQKKIKQSLNRMKRIELFEESLGKEY